MHSGILQPQMLVAERYLLLAHLATGGYGTVYVAEQVATERKVALKVLNPHLVTDERVREQFTLEARVASRIRSEHVVDVLDAGTDAALGVTYLVMELLEGCDLDLLVERNGALPPDVALEYLRQTASGLDKAHRYVDRSGRLAPIIHRDLKPNNLFLTTRSDGSPLIKILDFGIAKMLSASTKMSGDVKGTPLYMAYEQAVRGHIGPATDIWSFGLIAFFLLTGRNYWQSASTPNGTLEQVFAEILTLPLHPAGRRAADLGLGATFGPEFDRWFLRCVNRDPAQRFQSIAEAMQALNQTGLAGAKPLVSPERRSAATLWQPSASFGASSGSAARAASIPETLVAVSNQNFSAAHGGATPARRTLLIAGLIFAAGVATAVAWSTSRSPLPRAASSAELTPSVAARPSPNATVAPPTSASHDPAAVPPAIATEASATPRGTAPVVPRANPKRPKRTPRQDDDLYGER